MPGISSRPRNENGHTEVLKYPALCDRPDEVVYMDVSSVWRLRNDVLTLPNPARLVGVAGVAASPCEERKKRRRGPTRPRDPEQAAASSSRRFLDEEFLMLIVRPRLLRWIAFARHTARAQFWRGEGDVVPKYRRQLLCNLNEMGSAAGICPQPPLVRAPVAVGVTITITVTVAKAICTCPRVQSRRAPRPMRGLMLVKRLNLWV